MPDNKVQVTITGSDQTAAAFQSAQRGLSSLSSAASTCAGVLGALGIGHVVSDLVGLAKNAFENADALDKMSQKVGMSVEFLSKLQYGAKLADVDLSQLTTGLAKFDNAIVLAAQGNAKAQGAFSALGIDIRQAMKEGQSGEQILLRLMHRFS